MNHVYRLIWSPAHQALIAVSELTLGPGKKSLRKLSLGVMAVASVATPLAQAGPQGGEITAGNGSISQAGATTTITQGSQNLSVNWQSFNTSSAESVKFVQPSTSAVAVNRIADANPTQFFGQLDANGKVYLVNPNGIVFGAGSQVNVGALVASTLDISDRALSAPTQTFSGSGTGTVVNQGNIATKQGGYVAFVGNKVENQGTIKTPGGATALGAGSEVTLSFTGDKLVNLQVDKSTLQGLAQNGGLIQADGGAVVMSAGAKDAVLASVVNNTGIVQARSVQNVNGTIVLGGGAESVVSNSGTLDASGRNPGETGGVVKVLGDTVNLEAHSSIDVSADLAGGMALVGGNFLGAGPERNAKTVSVTAGSTLKADALGQGKGGKVAVWSDGSTTFEGAISARAGQRGGDGGAVETSGKRLKVGAAATVDTSAAQGRTGEWLLDPQDLRIGGFSGEAYDIGYDQITQALETSNVTIKTGQNVSCTVVACGPGVSGNGDIILQDGIAIGSWSSSTTLTLSALRNVQFQGNAVIDASGGGGNIVLRADNTGTGIGTIDLGRNGAVYADTGSVDFYYNPTFYSRPTDYAGLVDPDNGNNQVNAANFKAYMLVNFTANVASKTYDGTAATSISNITGRGSLPSDAFFDFSRASVAFADQNAGTGKAVTISGVNIGGGGASKYAVNGLDSLTADIFKADALLTGIAANSKTYDGTTLATLSGSAVASGIVAGDAVAVAGSGMGSTFDSKNVGTLKPVNVTGYTLTGASAGNYNLVLPTGLSAEITPASLQVVGIAAADKVYDSTTGATLSGTATVAALGSDVVAVTGTGIGTFASKNVANNQAVSVTGYTLSGADAGNYSIVQPTGLSAAITRASLTLSGVSAADKVYDGTTAATLTGTAAVAALGSDDVSVGGTGSASFFDKNAGADKAVDVSGYALGGLDAGNYELVQPAGLTASIGKADLALSGIVANNKTYDGTTAATLSGTASVSPIGSDVVAVTGSASGNFLDKNAGVGKAVSVSGFTLAGADAGNYNLAQPTNLSATIAKADLAITGVAAADKVYDATTAATLVGTAAVAALGSDVVTVDGTGNATFADKNAGAGKAVTTTGYTLAGADAGNYNAIQPTGLTADILKADLALDGLTVADKTYDGTTSATLTGSPSVTGYGGDVLNLTGSGSAAFDDKNAGIGKAVSVSGYTLGGADAGNYNLVPSTGLTATIGKASLAVAGLGANGKTYDGTTAAALNGTASVTPIGADAVTLNGNASGAFADKNAGAGKSVFVSGLTLTGLDAGNYTLIQPALVADIAKASLGITGLVAADKTYDGTTSASLDGLASVNAFGSDVVSVADTGTATFADKNAGVGKTVTVSGYSLGGTDAGNYTLLQPTGLTATIGKALLALTGLGANSKVYDGTAAATLNGTASVSPLGADAVSLVGSATGQFVDKNAGSGKAVTVTGYALSGADAGNYTLVQPNNLTADIAKANLAVTGVTAADKVYDGTTAATLNGTAQVSAFGNDAVALSGTGTAAFADKNAGTGKVVTASGYTLTGSDAGNYNLVQPIGLNASISRADLAVTGVAVADKVYDGTAAATLNGTASVSPLGADAVSLVGSAAGQFIDKNAGTGKAVTVTGYALSGADAGNYTLVQPSNLTADITKANLAVTGVAAVDKVYDGTTAATLNGTAQVNVFGNDAVALSGTGTAAFADKNVGTGKAVTVSGYSLGGADAGNYNLLQPTSLTATIGKALLALTGLGANSKVYDGTAAATLNGTASVAPLGADAVSLVGSATGLFVDKNAGIGKAVTVTGYALSGADAGNYTLVQPSNLTADITKANLAVTGIAAADKVYDGTTAATLNGTAQVNAFGNDAVVLSGTGTAAFVDKNAGTGKAVTASGYTLSGSDAGNYDLVQPVGLSASISRATLAVTGVAAADKVYDGTTAATLNGTAQVNAFGNDAVSLSNTGIAAFADKNAGTGKTVTASGYTLTGSDAGNYSLVQPIGLSASISRASLAVTGVTASDKTYDGTTLAALTGNALVTGFGNDVLRLDGSGVGAFSDKQAGTGKSVLVSGYTLAGADAGNYTLIQPAGLTATIARADLALAGLSANGKVYDGTTAATLSGTASVSALAGDSVTLSGNASGNFADKQVGVGKAVTVSGYSLSGADAVNYNLVQPTALTADIRKAALDLSGLAAANKIYDGTTAATLIGAASINPLGNDSVFLSGPGTAAFADKNVGAGKAVRVDGFGLTGADAENYTLVLPMGLSADVTPASLMVSGISARSKLFDGGRAAAVDASGARLNGLVAGDDVKLASAGTFADASVGTGKTVTLSNELLGADSRNYLLAGQTTALADILALPIVSPLPIEPVLTVQDAVAQVQSFILAPQAKVQPRALSFSSTLDVRNVQQVGDEPRSGEGDRDDVLLEATPAFAAPAPLLTIQNGGVQLPPFAASDKR
nr:YDG domain-containing protein [uncultured Pseudomonas sp.]